MLRLKYKFIEIGFADLPKSLNDHHDNVLFDEVDLPMKNENRFSNRTLRAENDYILAGQVDRERIDVQAKLFASYLLAHASVFIQTRLDCILDVGCGEGQLTEVLARLYPDATVIGVDRDPRVIETAQHTYADVHNLRFETADAQDHLPCASFDLVHASALLMHVTRPQDVLRLAFERLTAGGYLWIREVDTDRGVRGLHPVLDRMMELITTTMQRRGMNFEMCRDIEPLLHAAQYTEISAYDEVYDYGSQSLEGQILFLNGIAGFHNSETIPKRGLTTEDGQIPQTSPLFSPS